MTEIDDLPQYVRFETRLWFNKALGRRHPCGHKPYIRAKHWRLRFMHYKQLPDKCVRMILILRDSRWRKHAGCSDYYYPAHWLGYTKFRTNHKHRTTPRPKFNKR